MKKQQKLTANAEFYKGKYYGQLLTTFMTIAILVSVFFVLLATVTFTLIQKNEANSQRNFAQNRYSLVDTAIAVVSNSMDSFIRNPLLEEWADSDTKADYYTNAITLLSHISLESSQLGALAYEITVVSESYNSMTLSRIGSSTRDWYFENETTLSDEQIRSIYKHFSLSDSLLVLPAYSIDGILQELYFIRQQQWDMQNTLVIFNIIAAPMFTPKLGENFCLIGANGQQVYGRNDLQSNSLLEPFLPFHEDIPVFTDANNRYFSDFLHTSSWKVASVFEKNKSIQIVIISFFILFSTLLFILCRQAAKKIAYKLYSPLGKIVTDSLPDFSQSEQLGNQSKRFDEFEVLRKNSQKISILARELQNTIEEKELLTRQNYYRELLEGIIPESDENDNETYYTALILSTSSDETPYVQFFADAHTLRDTQMHYVQYGSSSFALVLQCNTRDDAIAKLKTLLRTLENEYKENIDILVALSNAVCGKINICKAFNQSRFIAEYRHTVPGNTIITEDMLKKDTAADFYKYPLEIEQKLLTLIVDGSSKTGEYFECIIHDNVQSQKVSTQRLQNLVYALTGTLVRSLQELKTTTTDLLGISIDWSRLYSSTPNEAAFSELKDIAQKIADAVHNNASQRNVTLLTRMQDYIHKNFSDDIQLFDLAQEFNITPKHCSKVFFRVSNEGFKNYLNSYRIEQAKLILEKTPLIKITDLSLSVGFNSSTSFIRVFNKYAEMTPKAYADKILSKNI